MVRVSIPSQLIAYTDGATRVEAAGATVAPVAGTRVAPSV